MKKRHITCIVSLLIIFCACSTSRHTAPDTAVAQVQKGKNVRPKTKDGWQKFAVTKGITYWSFSGYDPISQDSQIVSVADIDLNKGFKLKIHYGKGEETSRTFLRNKAFVAMNGGYETSSIYIKENGNIRHEMANDQIFSTGVPNWKNDGAICIAGDGTVSICNSMCSRQGQDGTSQYGAALEEQRTFYKSTMRDMDNIISSAPLLIYDYQPVGLTFVPEMSKSQMESLRYEDPLRHQGVRHPRTAIALTGNNHLLMLVVDGRRPVCCGFTARELTNFFIRHFNPRYALNLDGGGSSTLCVAGNGDAETHVVNHPSDNGKMDHAGERKVATVFYVTE